MTELIMNMLICLLGALLLGFIFGYLIAKAFGKKRHAKEVEELNTVIEKKDKERNYLIDDIHTMKKDSDSHLANLTHKDKLVEDLHMIVEEKDTEINTINEKFSKVQEELKLRSSKLNEAEEEIENLNFMIKKKNEDTNFLEEKLLKEKKNASANLQKLNEVESEIEKHKSQVTELKSHVDGFKDKVTKMSSELTKVKDNIEINENKITKLKTEEKNLQSIANNSINHEPSRTEKPTEPEATIDNASTKDSVFTTIKGMFNKKS